MSALRERRKLSLPTETKIGPAGDATLANNAIGLIGSGCSSKDSTTSGRSSSTTPTQSLLTPPATSPTTPQVAVAICLMAILVIKYNDLIGGEGDIVLKPASFLTLL